VYAGSDPILDAQLTATAGMNRRKIIGYPITKNSPSAVGKVERGGPLGRTNFAQLEMTSIATLWDGQITTLKNTTWTLPSGNYRLQFVGLSNTYPLSKVNKTYANDVSFVRNE
jgi:hypothetical protein